VPQAWRTDAKGHRKDDSSTYFINNKSSPTPSLTPDAKRQNAATLQWETIIFVPLHTQKPTYNDREKNSFDSRPTAANGPLDRRAHRGCALGRVGHWCSRPAHELRGHRLHPPLPVCGRAHHRARRDHHAGLFWRAERHRAHLSTCGDLHVAHHFRGRPRRTRALLHCQSGQPAGRDGAGGQGKHTRRPRP